MPRLLSGSTLRNGGSGEFINLADAQPQLPPTDTTATGFTVITNSLLQTRYASSLGFIEFNSATLYSSLLDGQIRILATGSSFLSTSTTTGNLVVGGGIGVGGNMYIADDIIVNGLTVGKGFEGVNNISLSGPADPIFNEEGAGQNTIVIGYNAAQGISSANRNIAIGRNSISTGTELTDVVAIGDGSLKNIGTIDKIVAGTITAVELSSTSTISSISNTNPIVVTANNHNLSSGDQIYITGVQGVTSATVSLVNQQTLYIAALTTNTFSIYYDRSLTQTVNGVGATSYTSGGTVFSPVIITVSGAQVTTGSYVYIEGVVGTVELNEKSYYLTQITSNTFGLFTDSITETPVDGSNYTTYVSGGTLYRKYLRNGNVAYGSRSGESLVDGSDNVFFGHESGKNLTTGSFNIILGHNKLPYLYTGSGIISIGGDNIVNGLDNQVNIGSVFYYDGRGYSYISADTSIGLGTDSTGTTTGALIVAGGVGIAGNLFIGGRSNIQSDINATSTSTGALVVAGGVGIGKDLWIGGTLYVNDSPVITTGTIGGSITGGQDIVVTTGGAGELTFDNVSTLQTVTDRGTTTSNVISITNATTATSLSNAALIVSGGIAVGENILVDGTVSAGTAVSGQTVTGFITNNSVIASYTSNTISSTSTQTLDSWSIVAYRTAKYLVQIIDTGYSPNKVYISEILVMHDSSGNLYKTEYGIVSNQGSLGNFDFSVQSTDVVMNFTANWPSFVPISMVIKVVRTSLTA